MKNFLSIFFSDEIAEYKSYSKPQRRAYIYFLVSFILFWFSVCTTAVIIIFPLALNLLASVLVAIHYIPDFDKDK